MYKISWKEPWYCDWYSGVDDFSEEFETKKEAKAFMAKLKKEKYREAYDIKCWSIVT